jgi:hypothetical protein
MSSGTELVKAGRPSQKSSVQRHLSVLVSVGVLIVFLTYVVVSQQFAFRIPYGNEIFASISCIIRSAAVHAWFFSTLATKLRPQVRSFLLVRFLSANKRSTCIGYAK